MSNVVAFLAGLSFLFFLSAFVAYIFGGATRLGGSRDSRQPTPYKYGYHPKDIAAWEADHQAIKSDWRSVIHWDDEAEKEYL